MGKKRIAFITNSFARGGAERVLSRIIPILKESYEIYLLLIDGSRIEYECPVEIIKMGAAERRNRILYLFDQIAAKRKLEKIIKEKNIECVISFLGVPNLINIFAKADCRKIVSVRGEEFGDEISNKVKRYLCRKMFYRADVIVCVSRKLCQNINENYHIGDAKVVAIENPYNISEISLLAKEEIEKKEKDFYAKYRVITAVGRMTKEKGYINLIDSFYRLLQSHKDIGLAIIGDGEERKTIEEEIQRLGIEENVLLCGMKANPYPYIINAQLFVLSSIAEGFPNTLVEAMCLGIPVVACDCQTGPREILYQDPDIDAVAQEIEMADYGILVPDFTSGNNKDIIEKQELLADAVETMLENHELRQQYGRKALERAQYYTFERCIEKYKEVIG